MRIFGKKITGHRKARLLNDMMIIVWAASLIITFTLGMSEIMNK